MISLLSRYATPLITGLFLVSLVSGIALFFHVGTSAFREMHEILSMVLILPFGLHVWKNWRAFMAYFKRVPMMAALAGSLAVSLAFAVPAMTGSGGGSPQAAIFGAFENGSVSAIAPLFGHDGESLATVLKDAGFAVASVDDTVKAIASASGKPPFAVIGAIAAAKR